jgi:hypothetical protein
MTRSGNDPRRRRVRHLRRGTQTDPRSTTTMVTVVGASGRVAMTLDWSIEGRGTRTHQEATYYRLALDRTEARDRWVGTPR